VQGQVVGREALHLHIGVAEVASLLSAHMVALWLTHELALRLQIALLASEIRFLIRPRVHFLVAAERLLLQAVGAPALVNVEGLWLAVVVAAGVGCCEVVEFVHIAILLDRFPAWKLDF